MSEWTNNENLEIDGPMIDAAMAAIDLIRDRRLTFVSEPKENRFTAGDVVTDVDREAQAMISTLLDRQFPSCGIIGEEGLSVRRHGVTGDAYWTVDPIDGTLAFSKRQPHGFSVMLALVVNGTTIAACIGDVMAGLVYCFSPGQPPRCEDLVNFTSFPLEGPWPHPSRAALTFGGDPALSDPRLLGLCGPGRVFPEYEINRGSVGLRAAELLVGARGGMVLRGGRARTPWDDTPVDALLRACGFVHLELGPTGFRRVLPEPVKEPILSPLPVLIVHEDYAEEFTSLS